MRMNSSSWIVLAVVACTAFASTAQAVVSTFTGTDTGAGPGDARPNSDGAAASFTVAAGGLGLITTIDLEAQPLGLVATSLSLDPNTTITEGDLDHAFASVESGGSAFQGFNTTAAGSNFIQFTEAGMDEPSVSLHFDFADPIQAWGAYLTGIGAFAAGQNGNSIVLVEFENGVMQSFSVPGTVGEGGASYFGFTDPGNAISRVSVVLDPVGPLNNDVIGIDDISYVLTNSTSVVPEPTTAALGLMAFGGLLLGRYRLRRRFV